MRERCLLDGSSGSRLKLGVKALVPNCKEVVRDSLSLDTQLFLGRKQLGGQRRKSPCSDLLYTANSGDRAVLGR